MTTRMRTVVEARQNRSLRSKDANLRETRQIARIENYRPLETHELAITGDDTCMRQQQ